MDYPKPKWLLEDEKEAALNPKLQQTKKFIYPVPIVENSGKVRERKPTIYRKINYNLP